MSDDDIRTMVKEWLQCQNRKSYQLAEEIGIRPQTFYAQMSVRKISANTKKALSRIIPELAADAREALLGTFTGVIERAGGRFTADHWGMRDLAYPVRKQMRGYFVRLEYVAPGDTVAELERIIRISDGAFKFLTVKLADAAEEVA